jgi:calcium-dependent protein kinase
MGCGTPNISRRKGKITSVDKLSFQAELFIRGIQGNIRKYYFLQSELGDGAYGKVVSAVHRQTGERRAIKIIKKRAIKSQIARVKFMNEVALLSKLDHPNILKLYEFYEDDCNFYLVTEICTGGELLDEILRKQILSEALAATYMKQILSAVVYCHNHRIVHRDLKLENIMFVNKQPDALLKVIDFGTSVLRLRRKKLTQRLGTLSYLAPEVLKNKYDEKCDVWSCGVILYILLSGKMPFVVETEEQLNEAIQKGSFSLVGPEWSSVSDEAKSLVMRMLTIDPKKRISAEKALKNEWLNTENQQENFNLEQLRQTFLNLQTFRAKFKLQKAVLIFMATQLISQEEKSELNAIFSSIDTSKDGRIARAELIKGCERVFGYALPEEEIRKMMEAIDFDNSGYIDYSEFIIAAIDKNKLLSRDRLERAFTAFDKDGNGRISAKELRDMLESESPTSPDVWDQLIQEVDQNGDGEVDLAEFKTMMLNMF